MEPLLLCDAMGFEISETAYVSLVSVVRVEKALGESRIDVAEESAV